MLERILREIPKLTDAVVARRRQGQSVLRRRPRRAPPTPSREAGKAAERDRPHDGDARPSAPRARPARCRASPRPRAQIKGAVASEGDLAIARYDSLTADEIAGKLAELSQIDLAKIDAYERKNQNRTHRPEPHRPRCAATSRGPATTSSPSPRCRPCSSEGDDERAKQVRAYERAHKNRAGVLQAAERELASA